MKLGISSNTRQALQVILELIATGAVQPVIDRVYPMSEVATAHRHVESRHKRGSVVLAMVEHSTRREPAQRVAVAAAAQPAARTL